MKIYIESTSTPRRTAWVDQDQVPPPLLRETLRDALAGVYEQLWDRRVRVVFEDEQRLMYAPGT